MSTDMTLFVYYRLDKFFSYIHNQILFPDLLKSFLNVVCEILIGLPVISYSMRRRGDGAKESFDSSLSMRLCGCSTTSCMSLNI